MVSNHTSATEVPIRKCPGIIGKFWTSLEAWIPFGYQDATGFHYGIEFISLLLQPPPANGADPQLT